MRSRTLLFSGMLLFLLGLLGGTVAQLFHNPRLAVSGHLLFLLNGLFLLVVGLAWSRFKLGQGAKKAAAGLLVFGGFANPFLTFLGAAWGTKKLTPIAGAGYDAAEWQETTIMVGLAVMILAMLAAVGLLTYGLRGDDPEA